eukprot:m.45168 g.45168  ORF g.45168 m.45168 type:complete len:405 (-) comp11760_c0_seq1:124-1338(-)
MTLNEPLLPGHDDHGDVELHDLGGAQAYNIQQPAKQPAGLGRQHRFVDRSAAGQSRGRCNVKRNWPRMRINRQDWFHFLLSIGTGKILFVTIVVYLCILLVLAGAIYAVREGCNVGTKSFGEAIYFSVEVFSSIGYGAATNDPFFASCPEMLVILIVQYLVGLIGSALFMGLIYGRLARPGTKAASVVFSSKAVVRCVNNRLHFCFRVCQSSQAPMVEAQVRCYALRHAGATVQTAAMRIWQPDDDLGSYLFLSLPSLVLHSVDAWSPLIPPGTFAGDRVDPSCSKRLPHVLCRGFESEINSRTDTTKGRCKPPKGQPGVLPGGALQGLDRAALRAYWEDTRLEVLVLVEAVDALTACSVQARYSYTADDIEFDKIFAPCCTEVANGCEVDFVSFQQLLDIAPS